jgi:predicted nucleic acid-binding protein
MTVLFDTNVILDVLLDREPYSLSSANVLSYVEAGKIIGFLGATTITTIHYIAQKAVGKEKALQQIDNLLCLLNVAPVDKDVLKRAIHLNFKDFEDSVLHEAGKKSNVTCIVTRNINDFKNATLPIWTPEQLLEKLTSEELNSSE